MFQILKSAQKSSRLTNNLKLYRFINEILVHYTRLKEFKTMKLYSAVKTVARNNHKSIYQIERDLKLSNGIISKWNKSIPRADVLQDVADYLGVTTQFLFKLAREEKEETE